MGSGEKCEGHEKECMAKCLKVASSPCVQKVAKVCKGSKAPKKCFLEGVKKCKKDSTDDELEELEGKGGKPCPKRVAACKKKVAGWCGKDKQCWEKKFKWCMSHGKKEKEDDLEELEGGKPCPKKVAAC